MTSVTGLVNKDLAQWGSDMAVKWMTEHWFEWNPGGKSDERAINHAKYRWKDYRDERGGIGTGVHNHIEDAIEGREPEIEFLDAEQQGMVGCWEDFNFFTGIEYTGTERQVWGGRYGGTFDASGWMWSERLGRKVHGLLDWKTSKSAYFEYSMQLAALKNAQFQFVEVAEGTPGSHPAESKDDNGKKLITHWVEEPLPEFETAWIVHLRADDWAVYELQDEDLHLARFNGYLDAWWAERELKLMLSERGQRLDRPMNWFDPKKTNR